MVGEMTEHSLASGAEMQFARMFNVGEIGDDGQVADRAARAADHRLALRIGLGALAIGLVVGLVAALLPI